MSVPEEFSKFPRHKRERIVSLLADANKKYKGEIPESVYMNAVKAADMTESGALKKASIGAAGAVQGAAELVDLATLGADAARYGVQQVGNLIAPDTVPSPEMGLLSTNLGGKVREKIDDWTNEYTKPESVADHVVDLSGRTFGGMGVFGKAGKALKTKWGMEGAQTTADKAVKISKAKERTVKFLQNAGEFNTTSVGATLGASTLAADYLHGDGKENEDPSTLALIGLSTLGGLGGGVGANFAKLAAHDPKLALQTLKNLPSSVGEGAKNLAAKAMSKIYKFDPKLYEQRKDIGNSIAYFTDDGAAQRSLDYKSKSPFTAEMHRKIMNRENAHVFDQLGIDDIEFHSKNPNYDNATIAATNARNKIYEQYKNYVTPAEDFLKEQGKQYNFIDTSPLRSSLEGLYPDLSNKNYPSAREAFRQKKAGEIVGQLENAKNKLISNNLLNQELKDLLPSDLPKNISKKISKMISDFTQERAKNPNAAMPKELTTILKGLYKKSDIDNSPVLQAFLNPKDKMTIGEFVDLRRNIREQLKDTSLTTSQKADLAYAYKKTGEMLESYMQKNLSSDQAEIIENFKKGNQFYAENKNTKAFTVVDPETGELVTRESVGILDAADSIHYHGESNEKNFKKVFNKKDKAHYKMIEKGLSPEERKKFGTDIILQAAKSEEGHINLNGLGTWWTSHNKEARKAFLDMAFTDPKQRDNFVKYMQLIKNNKEIFKRLGNPSGTAHTTDYLQLIREPKELIKYVVAGLPGDAVSAAIIWGGTILGSRTWLKMMTDEKFIKRIYQLSQAKDKDQVKRLTMALYKTPFMESFTKSEE